MVYHWSWKGYAMFKLRKEIIRWAFTNQNRWSFYDIYKKSCQQNLSERGEIIILHNDNIKKENSHFFSLTFPPPLHINSKRIKAI